MTAETATTTNTSTSPTINPKTEKEDDDIADAKMERQRIQQIIEEWPKKCVSFITKIEVSLILFNIFLTKIIFSDSM